MPIAEPVGRAGACTVPAVSLDPGATVASQGLTYDRLALHGRTGRWRPVVELSTLLPLSAVLVVSAVGACTGVAALAGVASTADGLTDPVWDSALGLAAVAVLLPAVLLTVRWVAGRPAGSLSSVEGRVRWRWLATCLGPALALVTVHVLVVSASDGATPTASWPGWGRYAAIAAVVLLLVPLQAAAEEYLARGWLVQTLVSWTGSARVAAVLSSAVFVGLHGTRDPWAVADLAVFALAMCWLSLRTGGIEAAVALHAVVNVVYELAASTEGFSGPGDASAPDLRAQDALPGIAVTLLYSTWTARRSSQRKIPSRAPCTAREQ